MKKGFFLFFVVSLLTMLLFACNNSTTLSTTETTNSTAVSTTQSTTAPTTQSSTTTTSQSTTQSSTTITTDPSVVTHLVSFNPGGGLIVDSITVEDGSTVVLPSVNREGYTWIGWYLEAEYINEFNPATAINQDITLYGKWQINQYEISFFSNGGTNIETLTLDYNQEILNLGQPIKEGYTFLGWFVDIELITPFTMTLMPAYNLTIYAKWEINSYSLSVYSVNYEQSDQLYLSLFDGEELTSIQLGEFHTVALTSLGRVFTWGRNNHGQLGDGTVINKNYPVDITFMFALNPNEAITTIATGGFHNLALTSLGRVFSWGRNDYGQLGINSLVSSIEPIDITDNLDLNTNESVEKIALGQYHSALITSEKRVIIWGSNAFGEIGNNQLANQLLPLDLTNVFDLTANDYVIDLALGFLTSYIVTNEGRVFSWGLNDNGQLGNNSNDLSRIPVEITNRFSLNAEETIIRINTYGSHVAALSSSNRLFLWGNNSYGQLGNDTYDNLFTPGNMSNFVLSEGETIVEVSMGAYHSSVLTSSGRVFTWGSNSSGQLGDKTVNDQTLPVDISSSFDLNLDEEIVYVGLGAFHSTALTNQNRIFVWGYNQYGQLGNGNQDNQPIPKSLNLAFYELQDTENYLFGETIDLISLEILGYTFLGWYLDVNFTIPYDYDVMPAENVMVYGAFQINQYTINFNSNEGTSVDPITQDFGSILLEPPLPTKEGYTFLGWYSDIDLLISYSFVTIPAEDITLYAKWEINNYEVTYYTTTYIEDTDYAILLFPGEYIIQIETGGSHTGCLTNLGRVFIWGFNAYGQLGDGTEINKLTPFEITSYFVLEEAEIITELAFGYHHSMALSSNGRIFTWGLNNDGQLGSGDFGSLNIPTDVTSFLALDEGEYVTMIASGNYHTGVITSKQRILMWGSQNVGALGNNETMYGLHTPVDITSNFALNPDETIILLSLGLYSSSALTSSGRVFTWGLNNYGQLADGTTVYKALPQDVTSYFNLSLGESISYLNLGVYHGLVLTSEQRVLTWGRNESGQLGDGSTENRFSPVDITNKFNLSGDDYFVSASLALFHSLILSAEGKVYAWGYNSYGQLGDGSFDISYLPIDITANFNLSPTDHIITIRVGSMFSAAVSNHGLAFTWGDNLEGQIGDGTIIDKNLPNALEIFNLTWEHTDILTFNSPIGILVLFQEGYTFSGWYLDSSFTILFNIETMPANNIEVYGKWVANEYTINFIVVGGPEVEEIKQKFTTVVTAPVLPEITGYSFSGWYVDVDLTIPYEFTTMSAENIILYGEWTINQYTISFETDNGSLVDEINQDYGTVVNQPADPVKEGHTFIDWYLDEEFTTVYEFTTMPAENITVYALFEVNAYSITYYVAVYDYPIVVPLFPNEEIIQVVAGSYNSALLTSDGRVFIWGDNSNGSLGDGTVTSKNIPINITNQFALQEGEMIILLSLGSGHSAALTSWGRVFTWGFNMDGQLGTGDDVNRNIPTDITANFNLQTGENIVYVELGSYHSLAISSLNRIFTWGLNNYGQLGDNTNISKNLPVDITNQFNLLPSESIIQVALGFYHSSALTSEGRMFTWGDNTYGQIGNSTTTQADIPTDITSFFTLNPGEMIIKIALGFNHTAAITSEGRLFIWGSNEIGQLGDDTNIDQHTPLYINDNFILDTEEIITHVILGRYHTLVYTSNNRLFSFGDNSVAQLGDGDMPLVQKLPNNITANLNLAIDEVVVMISTFESHNLIITSTGRIIVWGYNASGMLGDGSYLNQDYPTDMPTVHLDIDSVVAYDYNTPLPNYELNEVNYVFDGWYFDPDFTIEFDLTNMPAENLILYAKMIYSL